MILWPPPFFFLGGGGGHGPLAPPRYALNVGAAPLPLRFREASRLYMPRQPGGLSPKFFRSIRGNVFSN